MQPDGSTQLAEGPDPGLEAVAAWDLLGWGCRRPCVLPVVKESISDLGNIPSLPVKLAILYSKWQSSVLV